MKTILTVFFKNFYFFLSNKNFRIFTKLIFFKGVEKRHQEKTVSFNGYKFLIPDVMSFVWQYYEIFFQDIFAYKSKNENPVILDCGANVGLATAYLLNRYPKSIVESFEPDPKVYSYLQKNIDNNFNGEIQLHQKAVWIKDEVLEFASEGADSGSVITDEDKTSKVIKVEAIDFKKKMQEFETIDFLKMDIEGAENDVIPHIASELHRVENLFLEFHSYKNKEQNLGDILDILSKAGFRYYLENILNVKRPFLKNKTNNSMDIQMNIFAYRK